MDSRFHGNDKPRRMSFPRKWESREGYLAYYPIIYLTFISRELLASHVPPSDGRKEQRKNRITFRRATEEQKRRAELPQSRRS